MPINTLSDRSIKAAIRSAADAGAVKPLSDGGGLSLLVQPTGAAWWRLRYWVAGKENRLSLGTYPAVSLADARRRRDEARVQIAAGTDPSQARKAAKLEQASAQRVATLVATGAPMPGTFEAVARDWLTLVHEPEVSPRYAARSRKQLEADVFPWIGARPAREVTPPVVLDLLRKVAARDALDTAYRVKQTIGLVMRHAISSGHADRDPTPDLREALPTHTKRHFPAILDPRRVGELLRSVDSYTGQPGTRAALQMAALTFQRPGNVRAMRWAHLDLDGALWAIPAAEMKRTKADKLNGAPHLVPLARQAVAILRELQPLTGAGELCFPGQRSKARPISDITLNAALRRLGFGQDEMTAHGFRAMARTLIGENMPGVDRDWIEAQLAHSKGGPLGAAYDRAQYLAQRGLMMQWWADWLDALRQGAQGLTVRGAA